MENEQRYLLVRWDDGREGGVLPEHFADPDRAEVFKGARVVSWEDGEEYDGPTTHEGAVRRVERETKAAVESDKDKAGANEGKG